ncbi:MAG: hypothetical protein IKI41_02460, partial [Clostridia bacterium]|nr:hypothetical protein [Clostridia bacterium]
WSEETACAVSSVVFSGLAVFSRLVGGVFSLGRPGLFDLGGRRFSSWPAEVFRLGRPGFFDLVGRRFSFFVFHQIYL